MILTPIIQFIGKIDPPAQLDGFGPDVTGGGTPGQGLLGLASNIIKLIMVVGGIWSFINLIIAGITYITAADNPDELKKANQKMTNSLIGLVIMFGSFTVAGIIGWLFFKDSTALLNPKIYSPLP